MPTVYMLWYRNWFGRDACMGNVHEHDGTMALGPCNPWDRCSKSHLLDARAVHYKLIPNRATAGTPGATYILASKARCTSCSLSSSTSPIRLTMPVLNLPLTTTSPLPKATPSPFPPPIDPTPASLTLSHPPALTTALPDSERPRNHEPAKWLFLPLPPYKHPSHCRVVWRNVRLFTNGDAIGVCRVCRDE